METKDIPREIQSLADSWGSPWVARKEIDRFSGGMLHPRTMANLDALKKGPPRFVVGGSVGYQVADLVEWIAERFRTVRPTKGE